MTPNGMRISTFHRTIQAAGAMWALYVVPYKSHAHVDRQAVVGDAAS